MADSSSLSQRTAPLCRNVTVSGRRTSVRMEPPMWDGLFEICERERKTIGDICTMVDDRRGENNLTASLRVFILCYFREAADNSSRLTGFCEPDLPDFDAAEAGELEYGQPANLSSLVLTALDTLGPGRSGGR
jgi:predicted DNA-binding ribbon-helix-helix protein